MVFENGVSKYTLYESLGLPIKVFQRKLMWESESVTYPLTDWLAAGDIISTHSLDYGYENSGRCVVAGKEEGGSFINCCSTTTAYKYWAHHIDLIYNDSRQLEWLEMLPNPKIQKKYKQWKRGMREPAGAPLSTFSLLIKSTNIILGLLFALIKPGGEAPFMGEICLVSS